MQNLLVATYALTAIAFVVLASAQLIQAHGGSTPGWVPVLAIAASVWAYAAGVVPMVYVIMSEMFNFQVRDVQHRNIFLTHEFKFRLKT